MEEAFEPADELGLRDAQLRSRGRAVLRVEGQIEAFELVDELGRQALFELFDGATVDLREPLAPLLVELGAADLFEQLDRKSVV